MKYAKEWKWQMTKLKTYNFEFEKEEYVCTACGGENWHVNMFFQNNKKQWFDDPDCDAWCADCSGETSITPATEYFIKLAPKYRYLFRAPAVEIKNGGDWHIEYIEED